MTTYARQAKTHEQFIMLEMKGFIPLGTFVHDEAERRGISVGTVYDNYHKPEYNLEIVKLNKRLVMVRRNNEQNPKT